MKVFLSQPMNGKTDRQIRTERNETLKLIREAYRDAELIDSFIREDLEERHGGLKYLAKSIETLDQADAIWMMKGWENARGCRIEHDTAIAYGIPVHYIR